ncbi:MAG: hypothetical protein Terrestrivirus1_275 [Terrestrivirus sp.]|uniref:Uncharacterized protein n=1 Tax=Terrestrivirus sp. TaxID=2487775 RepID=A0A3G4ZMX4_9VIRU|nr:MAG: hypothetical protein Terrestrivirus1_275 [Terrestrivirus sp.]
MQRNINYIPYGVPVDSFEVGPIVYPSGRSVRSLEFAEPIRSPVYRNNEYNPYNPYNPYNNGIRVGPLVNGENVAASLGYRFRTTSEFMDFQQSIPSRRVQREIQRSIPCGFDVPCNDPCNNLRRDTLLRDIPYNRNSYEYNRNGYEYNRNGYEYNRNGYERVGGCGCGI